MNAVDFDKLIEDLEGQLLTGARRIAILGLTPEALKIFRHVESSGWSRELLDAVYVPRAEIQDSYPVSFNVRAMDELGMIEYDVVVVAADRDKEDLLLGALPHMKGTPKIIVAGYGHLAYRDPIFRS